MSLISVIISVYSKDRLKYLLDCIDSLQKQYLRPDEIIVVLDSEPNLIGFYGSRLTKDVNVVVSTGFGLSNARNAGICSANGEIVAFIDDDAVADRFWLKNLIKNYVNDDVVGVGGKIKPFWEDSRPKWFPEELDWVIGCSYKGLPERKAIVRNPIGCNMSFRKEVFEKAGYFKPEIGRLGKRLLGGEEPELSIRISKKLPNKKIMYDPEAVVYHRVSSDRLDLKYLFTRSFYEGVSKASISNLIGVSSLDFSTEKKYLGYLLRYAFPSRLKHFYSCQNLSQSLILFFSLIGIFFGYATRKI